MRVYASAEMTLTDTNDGVSVTSIDRYYMASSSSSGITVDSQGWKPDPQETNPISRYHWSYEVVNYSDGAKIPSKPAVIGVYGKEGIDAVTVSLSSEAHTFAGTESRAITSSITIDISAFKGNQRIPTSIGTVTGGIADKLTHSELDRDKTTNKLVINVTNALDKSDGTLSIPIEADGKTFNKVFSWSVAFKGDTGDEGPRGLPGDKGEDGKSQWVHIRYSANSNGSNMEPNPSSTTKYVGIAVTNSAKAPPYTGFTWSKYVGEDGARGPQGIKGDDGDDGQTTYTWVRYADTPTSGMNQYPAGKKYIGLAFNQTDQNESNNYNDYQWSLMPQNIEIGGRNYFTKKTPISVKIPGSGFVVRGPETPNGFKITGRQAGDTSLRINNVITSNGWWTVSFDIRGSQSAYVGVSVDINDKGSTRISTNNKNTYERKSVSVYVDNYSETVHNFVDFDNFGWAHFFIDNIKVEKGNTATDWTEAPEDTQSQIDDKANQTDTEARLNEIASELLVKQQEIEAAATAGELDAFVKKYNQEQEAFAKEKKASEEALASAEDAIELITNKMDNMAETWEFFDEYIKFAEGSIILGNETEGSHVKIHNDRISFHSNGYEVASITQGKMTIEAGTFVEEIQISEFKFQKSSNGHLTVRHVG